MSHSSTRFESVTHHPLHLLHPQPRRPQEISLSPVLARAWRNCTCWGVTTTTCTPTRMFACSSPWLEPKKLEKLLLHLLLRQGNGAQQYKPWLPPQLLTYQGSLFTGWGGFRHRCARARRALRSLAPATQDRLLAVRQERVRLVFGDIVVRELDH